MFDLQGGFLGYRPSVGELIAAAVLAVLAERFGRLLSRAWNFSLDRISSLFDKLRIQRISALEKRITTIKLFQENDRKVILRTANKAIGVIILFVLGSITLLMHYSTEILFNLHLIVSNLHINALPLLGKLSGNEYITESDVWSDNIAAFVLAVFSIAVLMLSIYRMMVMVQEMVDFSDPPKAIRALEERIGALMAKGA